MGYGGASLYVLNAWSSGTVTVNVNGSTLRTIQPTINGDPPSGTGDETITFTGSGINDAAPPEQTGSNVAAWGIDDMWFEIQTPMAPFPHCACEDGGGENTDDNVESGDPMANADFSLGSDFGSAAAAGADVSAAMVPIIAHRRHHFHQNHPTALRISRKIMPMTTHHDRWLGASSAEM